jgi:hypothetical protein
VDVVARNGGSHGKTWEIRKNGWKLYTYSHVDVLARKWAIDRFEGISKVS